MIDGELLDETGARTQGLLSDRSKGNVRATWAPIEGDYGTLSYEKMRNFENLRHPRKFEGGKVSKISLCESTGSLGDRGAVESGNFEKLGIGVSLYFKFLKSIVALFIYCTILSIPLMYIYSRGSVASQTVSLGQRLFTPWTLGNLGNAGEQCF
jgi:hypothetical protein